ncbi:MAG TPA: hypothetical protein V6C96_01195 [Vampirovibrionales bacterium]
MSKVTNQKRSKRPVVLRGDLDPERLALHLTACEDEALLAVDCEMMGLKLSRDRLCLVQMADPDGNITLVQIEPDQSDAPLLKKLLEDTDITKVFHFGRADLAIIAYQLGINVFPIFCTKVASKLARTYTEKHGLRDVTKEIIGLDLNKQQQSSDWGRDKLTPEQIEYAASDVVHLIRIKEGLTKMLEREERLALAERCFQHIPLLVELDILDYNFIFEHHPPNKN